MGRHDQRARALPCGLAGAVIRFPTTELITERARALKVPLPVVVRDLARIVEILNLREKNFFAKDSVLAGGMALRAYGSLWADQFAF